jgi:cytochrome c oxidase assembly factor CtaG
MLSAGSTLAWGLSPLEDQQLAGVIMWVPASFVYLAAMAVLFVAWLGDAERKASAAAPARPPASNRRRTGTTMAEVPLLR